MSVRLKVLISAYACSPYKGSEPGVGWGFVSALAQHHDLWVIVEEEKFRADIERHLAESPELAQSVQFCFLRKQRNRWLRKIWPPSYYWYYRRWHEEAFVLAQALHKKVSFDVAHQLTMVGFREPGYLWKLGIPFVWGPVGGMGLFPWRFLPVVGAYGALYYLGYNLFNAWQMRFLLRAKLAATIANSGLISMNTENRIGMVNSYSLQSEVCIPVGPPPMIAARVRERSVGEPLRVVWVGSHNPGKALNIGLRALSMVPKSINWELHVLGAGPLTNGWKKCAAKLGIIDRCKFYGQVSRSAVLQTMSDSHLHLFTSLREGTPSVIVEASALGVPTICLNLSGMRDMVINGFNGIKIDATSPAFVIRKMAEAIEIIARDESLRRRLANLAFESIRDLSWEKKAEAVDRIYQRVVGEPRVGMA